MQVANCTTPANLFHILRRQMHRKFRKPLVIMAPKSLLRHKRVISRLDEFGSGKTFHRVLWDDADKKLKAEDHLVDDDKIHRVVLCTGKVYYDLLEARQARGIDDIYLLRLEQLYPFPARALTQELERFKQADVIWCQEEPKNMGAWSFADPNIEAVLGQIGAQCERAGYAGRPASASTASGRMSVHLKQLETFLDEALAR